MDLYSIRLDGGPGAERLELSTPQPKFPTDWSADDRVVLFNSLAAEGGVDIAALRLDGTQRPFDVVKTPANEQNAQFSPDGRWIAYQSDKTGGFEIYVRPFPGPGADLRVSSNGGAQPRWNPRGQELFYVAADDRLMAVPMVEQSGMPEPGPPTALFVSTVGSTAPNTNRHQYSVARRSRLPHELARRLAQRVAGDRAHELDAAPVTCGRPGRRRNRQLSFFSGPRLNAAARSRRRAASAARMCVTSLGAGMKIRGTAQLARCHSRGRRPWCPTSDQGERR
jgi:serine/threonine-protein kinase